MVIEIKSYLHVSYMHLFDYRRIHNIHNKFKYGIRINVSRFGKYNAFFIFQGAVFTN